MNELALFAGAGGGILGGMLLGWRTVAAVEIEDYPRRILLQRQADGILPRFPIWDDVCTFDGKPWRGKVDVISGGFPCQDISIAGKGAGISGERSGLWAEMARIIREVEPRFAFVENSPMLTSRGIGVVLKDLAEMGYDARWGVLGADDAGAPHRRKRIWIVADARHDEPSRWNDIAKISGARTPGGDQSRGESTSCCRVSRGADDVSDTVRPIGESGAGRRGVRQGDSEFADSESVHAQRQHDGSGQTQSGGSGWWSTEPALGRVAHGVAHRVDRLKAIGNGQVSAVARLAWETLNGDTP